MYKRQTYNGDHMSMYGVNAGVPKTLVRHLVHYEADIAATDTLRTVLLDILEDVYKRQAHRNRCRWTACPCRCPLR